MSAPKPKKTCWTLLSDQIFGKAQYQDVPFYLVRDKNQPYHNAQWLSGIEAFQKIHWMIAQYDRYKIKYLKPSWYFIDEQLLEKCLTEDIAMEAGDFQQTSLTEAPSNLSSKSKETIRVELEKIKQMFWKKLLFKKKYWDLSSFAPLQVNFTRYTQKSKIKQQKLEFKTEVKCKKEQDSEKSIFQRPKLKIDYDLLNLKSDIQNPNRDVGDFLGRVIVDHHRLYLMKGKGRPLSSSVWIYCHQAMNKYSCSIYTKIKRIGIKANHLEQLFQLQFFVDRQKIAYELYKEKVHRIKELDAQTRLGEINQKHFYDEANQLYQIFIEEAQKAKILVQEKFQNQILKKESSISQNKKVANFKKQIKHEKFEFNDEEYTQIDENSLHFESQDNENIQLEQSKCSKKQRKQSKKNKKMEKTKQLSKWVSRFLEISKKREPEKKAHKNDELYFSSSDEEKSEYEYEWLDEEGDYCYEVGSSKKPMTLIKVKEEGI